MLLPRMNLIATVLIALIAISAMVAYGQLRPGAPSLKDAKDLIFCHVRDTGRAREGLGSSRLSMAVWNSGQIVVGAVRANGIEYLSATLSPEELTLLRSRLKDIDTAQGDQLLLPPGAAHTRFFVRNDAGAAEFHWTETRFTSGPTAEFQRMWTELYDITLGAIPAGLTPLALDTPEYERFSEAFPGYALTSLNAGYQRK